MTEPGGSAELQRHRRSSFVVSVAFTGRFCLGCDLPWPCPDAPADGSDGWDDDDD